ncbi:hypothetical protein KSS87_020617, partial [Heliosperma pusillum]
MQTMGNEGKLILHRRSYKCKKWVMKEDSLVTQGVTILIMCNEGRLIVQS